MWPPFLARPPTITLPARPRRCRMQACAKDDSDKTTYLPAVEGLVKLLRTDSYRAHEQASGALRSLCVNSPAIKLELNRTNGISAIVWVMRYRSLISPRHPTSCPGSRASARARA